MYLILSDVDGNATSSRTSEVFHDGVDVIELRAVGEENVRRRRFDGEGLSEKIRWRRSDGESPVKKGRRRRAVKEVPIEKI